MPDPVGGALDDRQIVAAAVADVSGVQAQIHEFGIRAVEEAVHVLFGVDVTVGVRMVLRTPYFSNIALPTRSCRRSSCATARR